ncbi:hypothetical protein DFJ73DRAFT_809717 [Zopfochytrium polystomum]|nr:hypothetical protein DFJ73DRAFT_809717 [Zopfochytrium polystomum]
MASSGRRKRLDPISAAGGAVGGAPSSSSSSSSSSSTSSSGHSPTPAGMGVGGTRGSRLRASAGAGSGVVAGATSGGTGSDDGLRRSVEVELSRRRASSSSATHSPLDQRSGAASPSAGQHHRRSKPRKGTVASMNPTPAVAVHESARVLEAAAYMAAKRVDAVLIVDSEGHLSGILTDRDVSFRVVAESLDPRTTTVSAVMTQNPVSVVTSGSALDALNRMVAGHFRHVPVIEGGSGGDDDDAAAGGGGGVVGVLDITKCLHDALERLERAQEMQRRTVADDEAAAAAAFAASSSSASSSSAGGGAPSRTHLADLFRVQLAGPDLRSLLAVETAPPPVVGVHDTVLEAARRMKAGRETAALVFDVTPAGQYGGLAGIFTSKDIVLRVLVAGLDPAATAVSRVMTPHPDCVYPDTSVLAALRKMHAGRYLHLPVVDHSGMVEGLVDVLKLTYSTLAQLNSLRVETGESPFWNRFWEAALSADFSGSEADSGLSQGRTRHSRLRGSAAPQQDGSVIYPEDSASRVSLSAPQPSTTTATHQQAPSNPRDAHQRLAGSTPGGTPPPVPSVALPAEGSLPFTFKLRDVESGKVHRLTSPGDRLQLLREAVTSRLKKRVPLSSAPRSNESARDDELVELSYIDDEGDFVHMQTDDDLVQAVSMAKACGWARLLLVLDSQRALIADNSTSLSGTGTGPSSSFHASAAAVTPSMSSSTVTAAAGIGAVSLQSLPLPPATPPVAGASVGNKNGLARAAVGGREGSSLVQSDGGSFSDGAAGGVGVGVVLTATPRDVDIGKCSGGSGGGEVLLATVPLAPARRRGWESRDVIAPILVGSAVALVVAFILGRSTKT